MKLRNVLSVLVLLIAAGQLSACAASPAAGTSKTAPAKVEPIAGTAFKRLTLIQDAAKRLDIQTSPVRESQIVRKRKIGGEVVTSPLVPAASGAQSSDTAYVRLRLSENELTKVDQSQPALVQRLAADAGATGVTAQAVKSSDLSAFEDKATTLVYAVVGGAKSGLAVGQRVLVEVALAGGAATRKLIPSAAVLYDPKGETWTYTSPAPLVFVRQSIRVDYMEGDQAILTDGPAAGTAVVTVGAAELFGIEFGVGK